MNDHSYDNDNELLSQYLDGELDSKQSLELKRRLLAEPELRTNLDRLQRVNTRVLSAFNQPGADSVPPNTLALLEQAGVSTPAAISGKQRNTLLSYAVAATIAIAAGVVMVPKWGADTSPHPQSALGVDLQLSQVLEATPSLSDDWAQLDDGRAVRPILSFQARSGNWCREFLVQHDSRAQRGIACRGNQNWDVKVLAAAEVPGSSNDYRPAGSDTGEIVAGYVAEHAADIALDRSQEAELIASGWQ